MCVRSYSFIVLSSLAIEGCSTNQFERNRQFYNTGTVYTETVDKLLTETKKRLVDVDSELLLISLRKTKEERYQAVMQRTIQMTKLHDMITEFQSHNRLLDRYFTELKVITSDAEFNDFGMTIGKLSEIIANVNKETIDKNGYEIPPRMTSNQAGYLGTMTDNMIKHHFAKKIRRQLLKDKAIISTQIYLQGKQLDKLIDILANVITEDNILLFKSSVVKPYVLAESPESQSLKYWKENRAFWFKQREANEIFQQVKEAQQSMLWAWEDIVRGKRDISSVNSALKNVNDFSGSLSNLHNSTK